MTECRQHKWVLVSFLTCYVLPGIAAALPLLLWFFPGMVHGHVRAQSIPAIIPQPVQIEVGEGYFTLNKSTVIHTDPLLRPIADHLAGRVHTSTGYPMPVKSRHTGSTTHEIRLALNDNIKSHSPEAYSLTVSTSSVQISARKPAGVFYAVQTLLQLLPSEVFSSELREGIHWTVPCVEILDYPRFVWRGLMLDVARHFQPKENVKKLIDIMAMHKMNSLHLHLTDDQGWRIEIKKYPRLTEVGAWRKQTRVGHELRSREFDGIRHGGYYTQEDIRKIVSYAADRFVNVIPEIEMPGHAQAALAAYPELGNTSEPLEVRTFWGVNENIFNVEESTILFLQDVLREVMDLFPSQFIHVGGDEAPKKQWQESPRAQVRMKELGLADEHELQSWFIKRMDRFLADRGRRLIGWDEILEGGLAPGATVMSWRGVKGGITAARAGHDVVMAPTTHTYFDYYQADSEREPLAIGGLLPLEKVYAFDPVSQLTPDQEKHVLGVQGQIWTEYIKTQEHLEYMTFPRACALAEVAWTPPNQRNFARFCERLSVHLQRLTYENIHFRPLDPPQTIIGAWRSGQTSESYRQMRWDITAHVKHSGVYDVIFRYTGGAHRLDMRSVELLENDRVVSRDIHEGTTGARHHQNRYRLTVSTLRHQATYFLRALVRSDGGTDSNGQIILQPVIP